MDSPSPVERVAEGHPLVITEAMLRGVVACWAVKQSPYEIPDGLDAVLKEVRLRFYADPLIKKCMGTRYIELGRNRNLVTEWVEQLLLYIPQVQAWNERKNGNKSPLGFISMYDGDGRDPDD